jgi:hypothetical protein
METIDAFLKFLNSYPLWAKLLAFVGLFVTTVTLVFAPRTSAVTMRSAASQIAINVLFENSTADYVNIDWLDFDGNKDPQLRQTIAPGASLEVPTYVAHAWIVSNAHTGTVIKTIIVANDTTHVRIY